jgi:hypothetical protein
LKSQAKGGVCGNFGYLTPAVSRAAFQQGNKRYAILPVYLIYDSSGFFFIWASSA